MFDIEDYNYELPPELIAQVPSKERDHSRLLVADRSTDSVSDHFFFDLPSLLRKGDLLVVNDTRVIPARLYGRKESGGKVEVLVLEHFEPGKHTDGTRSCLLKSSKRPRIGSLLDFNGDASGLVEEILDGGIVRINFRGVRSLDSLIEERGEMPLPPYIKRNDSTLYGALDRDRYQTVYSESRGAIAAPTAGLHFTKKLISRLEASGISLAAITLHVGHGTFRPVKARDIRDHKLGREFFRIGKKASDAINRVRKEGGSIVAVGTTVVRALESAADGKGSIVPCKGRTDLMITPGYTFKVVQKMITNFHLPKSSLLFLVSAFTGREFTKGIYKNAVEKRYRFYSYGDAMLIH
jgi:S-adenosylmethionine:tRNA ribosyltransferase-isomerase